MWPVFGERAQHRNRNRVVRATLESSRALARTIRIQNFHMRLPWLAGEGWGGGMHARMWDCTPPPCPSPASGGGDDVAPPVDTPVSRSSLRLDADRVDQFRPGRELMVDDGGVLLGRGRLRPCAFQREPLAHLIARERGVERAIELVDHRARRAGR